MKILTVTAAAMLIAAIGAASMGTAFAADESPVVKKYIGTGPRVTCPTPLTKYRVVYDRNGKFQASTICIEKERVSTERGINEIMIHLLDQSNPERVVVVNVTPLTE